MRKRWVTWLGGSLLAALVVAWAVGELAFPRSNPPQRHSGTILSAQSDAVLRKACFDCHSNETQYPWYARLPVAGLMIGLHVQEGRRHLNFSNWDLMDAGAQRKAIHESLETLREGEMPLPDYRLLNPAAKVAGEQLASLERDAQARYGVAPERGEGREWSEARESGEHGEHGERDRD